MTADWRFGPDGTADPAPPPRYADPLAGLVTGGVPVTEDFSTRLPEIEIVAPVVPDQEALQEAVRAALADETPQAQRKPPQDQHSGSAQQWQSAPPPRATAAQSATPPRQSYQSYQRQQAQRTPLPAPRQAKVVEKKRRSPGCVIMLVLVLIVVFYNVFASLATYIAHLFH